MYLHCTGIRIWATDPIPTFGSLESRLYRRRSLAFPPVPATIASLRIEGEWAVTWADERHVTLVERQWGIVVFFTRRHARCLSQCDTIFVDGTFRTAPAPFYQMLTIHGLFQGTVIPFCFALMSGKTTGEYRKVFSHVLQRIRRCCGVVWQPTTAICDFEVALITAIETEIPTAAVRGCYFHFCQGSSLKESGFSNICLAYNSD